MPRLAAKHANKHDNPSSMPQGLPTHYQGHKEGGEDAGGALHAAMGGEWLHKGMGEQGALGLSMHIMPRGGGWSDLATTQVVAQISPPT